MNNLSIARTAAFLTILSVSWIIGCGAYKIPETPVKEFDFSVVKNNASRQDFVTAFGQPGKTTQKENQFITDEWLLSIRNHPPEPTIQKAMHIASAGMYTVLDHPTKTGVNRKTLKLLTATFDNQEKLKEAYIENVCYWGCQ